MEVGVRGPYRNWAHVLGIPATSGLLPPAVVEAHNETEHARRLLLGVTSRPVPVVHGSP